MYQRTAHGIVTKATQVRTPIIWLQMLSEKGVADRGRVRETSGETLCYVLSTLFNIYILLKNIQTSLTYSRGKSPVNWWESKSICKFKKSTKYKKDHLSNCWAWGVDPSFLGVVLAAMSKMLYLEDDSFYKYMLIPKTARHPPEIPQNTLRGQT